MKKCPNCGYKCADMDAFCAMCGTKLPNEYKDENIKTSDDNIQKSSELILQNMDDFSDDSQEKTINEDKNVDFDKRTLGPTLSSFIAIIISISLFMGFFLYLVIKKQESVKYRMRFNNMISNPALIPELKEPKNFLDLKVNLQSCENFLGLYLKHSNDPAEIKEQIFISYLIEMDKLPHITNENMVMDDLDSCSTINTSQKAQKCAKKISSNFKHVGILAYNDHNVIYLYPDYKFISKKYSKYLSNQMAQYLKLKAKYNTPARVGLTLKMKPKRIADKIYDFELLYSRISDQYIREEVLKTIYYDFRAFIFTPSIYATTTQEMKPQFKSAFNYFISRRRKSQLRPLVMSYMDKMRSYSEENFRNDYPYQIFDESFDSNVENSSLGDIFIQLRKRLFSNNSQTDFAYVYNVTFQKWMKYDKSNQLTQNEYIFSVPDSSNNIFVYNNTFSLLQELNIPKYSGLFLSGNSLFIYNSDRLNLSKITFNGRLFSIKQLSSTDASVIFPGIKAVNIDSYQNYNIYIEKDNMQADYIVLSKYSQGFEGYKLALLKGQASILDSFNMFKLATNEDVELSFHHSTVNPKETSDVKPTYRIIVHTRGYSNQNPVEYDEATANEEASEVHYPTIMPKIIKDEQNDTSKDNKSDNLDTPPKQYIEPPLGD